MDKLKIKGKEKKKLLSKVLLKHSLSNYVATLIGVFIWLFCVVSTWAWFISVKGQLGILMPLVLIVLISLWAKLTFLIPRPITTYEEVEVKV